MATVSRAPVERLAFNRSTLLRASAAVVLSTSSGIFLLLAYPPYGLWPLMWVAFVPFLIAQYRMLPRRYSSIAPALALAVWLWPFLARIFGPDAPWFMKYMGVFAAVITLFANRERKLHEATGFRWFVLQGALAWVGFEMVRSFIPFLGTMGFVANALGGQAWLIQPVSIFSIYGLGLLVLGVNFTLALFILSLLDGRFRFNGSVPVNQHLARRWLVGMAAALGAWVLLSLLIFNRTPIGTQTVRVGGVQPYLPVPGHLAPEEVQVERLQITSDLIREAAGRGAKVIFTPEMTFGFDPQITFTEEVRALAAETNAYIFLSYALSTPEGFRNETVMLNPNGEFSEVYGKIHNSPGERPTVNAGPLPVFDTPYGKMGSVICMDAVFTDITRYLARDGAQLLAVPDYNGTPGIGEQNWTHAAFRSVENQVPVVNTDPLYTSAIFDTHGQIVDWVHHPDGGQGVVVADVTLGSGRTLTNQLGDWMGWVALAGFAFFTFFGSILLKRAQK